MDNRICKGCHKNLPLTTDNFNKLSGGTWRYKCKACMRATSKQHHESNPGMTAARRDRYKANLAAAEGNFCETDVDSLRTQQSGLCFYCAKILNSRAEVDHKIPLSRGGSNWPSNLCLACQTCNRDKNNKTAREYMTWRRQLALPVNKDTKLKNFE